jgi:hypothetical protein
MDIQTALEVAKQFRGIARRAETFGHDRETILERLLWAAENYERLAVRIEENMVNAA